jgi:hypothetical protein
VFCHQCGKKSPDDAKFCPGCGTALKAPEGVVKKVPVTAAEPGRPLPKPSSTPPSAQTSKETTHRTKTDLFIYERRGDEHNVLKKNFLFKPKRYKIPANTKIIVQEVVGATCKVETAPGELGKVFTGWVTADELALRTDWQKP